MSKKCNGCECYDCTREESIAMGIVKALKKRIIFLTIIIVLETVLILGIISSGIICQASTDECNECCILPEHTSYSEVNKNTKPTMKRRCIALKKKR